MAIHFTMLVYKTKTTKNEGSLKLLLVYFGDLFFGPMLDISGDRSRNIPLKTTEAVTPLKHHAKNTEFSADIYDGIIRGHAVGRSQACLLHSCVSLERVCKHVLCAQRDRTLHTRSTLSSGSVSRLSFVQSISKSDRGSRVQT